MTSLPGSRARRRLSARADRKDRQQLLKVLAGARRTAWRSAVAREVLETAAAGAALVFEQGHDLIFCDDPHGMSNQDRWRGGGWRELLIALLVSTALTATITYPWAFRIGRAGRVDSFDGQFSIWNVAWVARTLVADPLHLFDANIFYPHHGTLTFSETNLGAGALAVPAYWATGNPYLAHDSAVLAGFVLSATAFYYLARYLTRHRGAAAVAAICFTFCPFVFARTTQVQLLMTFGIPLTMLAFHRMVDRPSAGRAGALGAAMACQTIFCAYYGVFAVLMVGYSTLVVTTTRGLWGDRRHWTSVALAFGTALLLVVPLFIPYLTLQRDTGFHRPLLEARQSSADWRSYLTSSAVAHRWMLGRLARWQDVVFPGFVTGVFGIAGAVAGWRAGRGPRELVVLYGGLAGLAGWASFGPDAGLYGVLYRTFPAFTMMRAPSRFALLVAFGLSVLAAVAFRALLARAARPAVAGAALAIVAAGELVTPLRFPAVPAPSPVYRIIADRAHGAVIEMPFFPVTRAIRHTTYMLNSTAHWRPLINGFSDWIPPDFSANSETLGQFPSLPAFEALPTHGVRYAVFHFDAYDAHARADLVARLRAFSPYLRQMYADQDTRLYEIVDWPP